MTLNYLFQRIVEKIMTHFDFYNDWRCIHSAYFPSRESFGSLQPNSRIDYPCHVESPSAVYMEANTRLRVGACIINGSNEKVIIKKYTAVGPNCTIIPNNHQSTVGVPHFLLGVAHINDKSKDIIIEEDVWVGANVTMVAGAHLGRGCIVAAGAVVSRSVPPYSVVAGIPAKVIAKKFELEDILEHEKKLYTPEERLTREELETIFAEFFEGKKTCGTNKPLTKEDEDRILFMKDWYKFVEPF